MRAGVVKAVAVDAEETPEVKEVEKEFDLKQLKEYVLNMHAVMCESPLYKQAFMKTKGLYYHSYDTVVNLALVMAKTLEMTPEEFLNSDEAMVKRIFTYYIPIALWLEA